jgi:hypothetical protein
LNGRGDTIFLSCRQHSEAAAVAKEEEVAVAKEEEVAVVAKGEVAVGLRQRDSESGQKHAVKCVRILNKKTVQIKHQGCSIVLSRDKYRQRIGFVISWQAAAGSQQCDIPARYAGAVVDKARREIGLTRWKVSEAPMDVGAASRPRSNAGSACARVT